MIGFRLRRRKPWQPTAEQKARLDEVSRDIATLRSMTLAEATAAGARFSVHVIGAKEPVAFIDRDGHYVTISPIGPEPGSV